MSTLVELADRLLLLSPLTIFVVTLGNWIVVNSLMAYPEKRFFRMRYATLSIGNSPIGLPLGMFGLQAIRLRTDVRVSEAWMWVAVIVALVVPIIMTDIERRENQYTVEEQLTPSKIAHTVMLGLLSGLIVLYIPSTVRGVVTDIHEWQSVSKVWPEQVALIGIGVWITSMVYDSCIKTEVPHAHKSRRLMRKYGLRAD